MPIHDWTRVSAGTFHDFHVAWIAEIRHALNGGVLPPDYYAQAEQIAGPWGPDVLTLQMPEGTNGAPDDDSATGGVVVATAPRTPLSAETEMDEYTLKRNTLVIRHSSDDRIIALIEIMSPGNKSSRHALRSSVNKAVEALYLGYHLLVIDLFPPGPRDPQGIHAAIWAEVSDSLFALPATERLTLVAYSAGPVKRAFIEPTAVGKALLDMPLFLDPARHVLVPLEATYHRAFTGVPRKWRTVLEGTSPA